MKSDSQIQSDILQNLKWDPSVTHEHIGVSVNGGIVTLSGTVPTYAEKHAATAVAQRVANVKAVVEKIEVKLAGSMKRTDQDIAQAIVDRFSWDVYIPDDKIKVTVQDGWVALKGEVEWEYQRSSAANGIRNLAGVKGVSNEIRIKAKSVDPVEIKKKIEEALKRETEREAKRIAVAVEGSTVTLSGEVRSLSEKEDARWAAWSAPGVAKVENNLSVFGY